MIDIKEKTFYAFAIENDTLKKEGSRWNRLENDDWQSMLYGD